MAIEFSSVLGPARRVLQTMVCWKASVAEGYTSNIHDTHYVLFIFGLLAKFRIFSEMKSLKQAKRISVKLPKPFFLTTNKRFKEPAFEIFTKCFREAACKQLLWSLCLIYQYETHFLPMVKYIYRSHCRYHHHHRHHSQ